MLGGIGGRRRRGRQKMRWLDGTTEWWTWIWELQELVMLWGLREAWCAVIHGVAKSWTWLSDWTELNWWLVMLSNFSSACWPSACLLWKSVYSGPLSIFKSDCLGFLILHCMHSLYILDINPSLHISFANIFSHLAGCHFILLIAIFNEQKLCCWTKSYLFIFLLFTVLSQASRTVRNT